MENLNVKNLYTKYPYPKYNPYNDNEFLVIPTDPKVINHFFYKGNKTNFDNFLA